MKSESASALVAVDTMVLVWGIRKEGTDRQRKRAKWLFEQLEEDNAQIIIPSVALSEYLTAVEPQHHADVIARLTNRFLVHPFDLRCASVAASLFRKGKAQLSLRSRKGARAYLRADCLIIATAAIYGAKIFYSGDKNCRKLASNATKLTVRDLPTVAPTLFSDIDDEE